jgi:hypothetical protein
MDWTDFVREVLADRPFSAPLSLFGLAALLFTSGGAVAGSVPLGLGVLAAVPSLMAHYRRYWPKRRSRRR